MYFFYSWGGAFQKITLMRGGGMQKKSEIGGGSYNFQITLLQIPPAPPYRIENEQSLRKTVLKTQLSPFFFRVPCAMITAQSSVADPVCYVSFLVS